MPRISSSLLAIQLSGEEGIMIGDCRSAFLRVRLRQGLWAHTGDRVIIGQVVDIDGAKISVRSAGKTVECCSRQVIPLIVPPGEACGETEAEVSTEVGGTAVTEP